MSSLKGRTISDHSRGHGILKGSSVAGKDSQSAPCPYQCSLVPVNVPDPGPAQHILHPKKDVFILKVAKIGATGDRRCKMELELVTPKVPQIKPPGRIDTRETQCEPEIVCHCMSKLKSEKKKGRKK